MSKFRKLMLKILSGRQDTNIQFDELRGLLKYIGFQERIKGGHYIFTKDSVVEIINLQPVGSLSKAYQVKQVRNLIISYNLGEDDAEI